MKLSLAKNHLLFLNEDKLYASGDNFFGQISSSNPLEDYLTLTKLKSVVDISCSENYSLVVTKNGRVYYLGYNRHHFSKNVMYLISNLKGITNIVTNNFTTLAVDLFGQCFGFGHNIYGQLGLGHLEDKEIPTLIMSNVKQVSLSRFHSLFLTKDGKVYGSGSNLNNQLNNFQRFVLKPVLVAEHIIDIAAGNDYSLFLDVNNNVQCLGRDFEFMLKVKQIAAGRNPLMLAENGLVYEELIPIDIVNVEYISASEDYLMVIANGIQVRRNYKSNL